MPEVASEPSQVTVKSAVWLVAGLDAWDSGAVASIVVVIPALHTLTLPALSRARTWKVYVTPSLPVKSAQVMAGLLLTDHACQAPPEGI